MYLVRFPFQVLSRVLVILIHRRGKMWKKLNKETKREFPAGEDGEFWMDLDEFRKNFEMVEVLNLNPFGSRGKTLEELCEEVDFTRLLRDGTWTEENCFGGLGKDAEEIGEEEDDDENEAGSDEEQTDGAEEAENEGEADEEESDGAEEEAGEESDDEESSVNFTEEDYSELKLNLS